MGADFREFHLHGEHRRLLDRARRREPPESVWAIFRDTARWNEWNGGVERIELEGPCDSGTWLKTPEQPEPFRSLVDVRENERFVDETGVGDLIVRVTHRLERVGQKTRIT